MVSHMRPACTGLGTASTRRSAPCRWAPCTGATRRWSFLKTTAPCPLSWCGPRPHRNSPPLRHNECFAAATQRIPLLAPWTGAERFDPITDVLAGSGLSNTYRGQVDERAGAVGLFFVGDAVCTTNPAAGRGISLGLRQAAELVSLLKNDRGDYGSASGHFGSWCAEQIRPWYEDHVYWDAALLARFRGQDIDVDAPLSSDVICAAAKEDPTIWRVAGPFLTMQALPTSLKAVEEDARAVLRRGWRPAYEPGPSTEDLADGLAQKSNVNRYESI